MFEWLERAVTLPSGMNSMSDFMGSGGSGPMSGPPQIPIVSALPRMPFLSDALDAGRNVVRAAQKRAGRASTILTGKRKQAQKAVSRFFDTYSSPTL